nr:protein transport protein SEC23-like [Tanacetum cinerariifolium]
MLRRVGSVGLGFQNGGGVMSSGVSRFLLLTSEAFGRIGYESMAGCAGNRALRCTRVAYSVAAGLLGACLPGTGARIVVWSAKVMSWIVLLLPLTSGTLEINCSKDIKIQEIIGPCTSLKKNGPAIASTTIGQGNIIAWKLCGLDKDTCLTVFFNVSSTDKDPSGNVLFQTHRVPQMKCDRSTW